MLRIKFSAVLALVFLSACGAETSTPVPLVAAQATQIYSAAQSQVAQAQQDYVTAQESYRATVEASAQMAATKSAVQATLDASAIEEAQVKVSAAKAQLQGVQNQVALSQIQNISATHAMTVSAASAELSARATATAIVKDMSNQVMLADVTTLAQIVFTILLYIALPILLGYAAIVALHKWQQRDMIQQPHKDGPAFEMRHYLLKAPEPFVIWNPHDDPRYVVRQLPAGAPSDVDQNHAPIYDRGTLAGFVDTGTAREVTEAEQLRKRVLNFLRYCIEYHNAGDEESAVVPNWEKLNEIAGGHGGIISAREWMDVTDALEAAQCLSKAGGKKTLLIGEYMTFPALYSAVGSRRVTPHPVIRAAPNGGIGGNDMEWNSGKGSEGLGKAIKALPLRDAT